MRTIPDTSAMHQFSTPTPTELTSDEMAEQEACARLEDQRVTEHELHHYCDDGLVSLDCTLDLVRFWGVSGIHFKSSIHLIN